MSSVPNPSVPANPVPSVIETPAVPTTEAPPATTAPPADPATTPPADTPTTTPPADTPTTTPPADTPTTTPPADTPATTPPADTPTTTPPADTPTTTPSADTPTTTPSADTPTTTTPPGQDTVVITTSNDGSTIFLTSTSIAAPTNPATPPGVSTSASVSSSSSGADASSAPNTNDGGSSGGLTGTTKIVVAVVVPIIGVALIAIILLFLWKKRRRDKDNAEMRRKEVEDYGYNPNSTPAPAVGGSSSNGDELPYEMAENTVGYRGWGSTRKASNMGSMPSSTGTGQPLSPVFPENVHHQDNYGFATSPTSATYIGSTAPSDGGMSNAPLITTPPGYRPETADSSVIAAMTGPQTSDNHPGIRRGISNASSNYSVQSISDQSDVGMPPGPYDSHYYGNDGGYEGTHHNYSQQFDNGQDYAQYPPVIREVQARRNTQIETPTNTHFPQQGNSGIAQNF